MPEILLNGNPYSIMPGSYKRMGDQYDGAASGTWSQTDFFGGMRRPIQLERDRGGNGLCVNAQLGGMGIEPWPFKDTTADATLATAGTVRIPSIIAGNNCYVAINQFLYKSVALNASSWGAWTLVYTTPGADRITHLAQVGNKVICCRVGGDINAYDIIAGTNATYVAGWRGFRAVGYSGALVWSEGLALDTLSVQLGPSTKQSWKLDAPIEMIALHNGEIVIATKANMYTLGGRKITVDKMIAGVATPTDMWSEDPQPLYTPGVWTDAEDYQFILSFGGKLYSWIGNQVVEYNPTGDKQGWRAVGLDGRSCNGATVAGSWLIVAIATRTGASEVWAFDGSGWWCIDRDDDASIQYRVWPTYTGGAGDIDLVTFRDGSGSGTHDLYRLVYRTAAVHNYKPGASEYVSPMIHAGHPEADKTWQRIGAVWAVPEIRGNAASVDPVTMELEYSVNGGRSWTSAGITTIGDPLQRVADLGLDIADDPAISRYLILRAKWLDVDDWAPVLTGFWAEWELVGAEAKRYRWSMHVRAVDRALQDDGAVDPRTGVQLADDLWTCWRTLGTIPFQDVDYASTLTEHQVQIASIEESMPTTDKEDVFRASLIKLQMVQA